MVAIHAVHASGPVFPGELARLECEAHLPLIFLLMLLRIFFDVGVCGQVECLAIDGDEALRVAAFPLAIENAIAEYPKVLVALVPVDLVGWGVEPHDAVEVGGFWRALADELLQLGELVGTGLGEGAEARDLAHPLGKVLGLPKLCIADDHGAQLPGAHVLDLVDTKCALAHDAELALHGEVCDVFPPAIALAAPDAPALDLHIGLGGLHLEVLCFAAGEIDLVGDAVQLEGRAQRPGTVKIKECLSAVDLEHVLDVLRCPGADLVSDHGPVFFSE